MLEYNRFGLPVSRRADGFNRPGDIGFTPVRNRVQAKSFKAWSSRQTHVDTRARSRLSVAVELLCGFEISVHLGDYCLVIQ